MYYWETNYYLKRHCQVFQNNLNLNQINLEDKDKVCLGSYLPGVRLVYMRQDKPSWKSVADAKKLWYLTLPLPDIQILRIKELNPDPYFSDEKVEYVFLNLSIDGTRVLAACIN